jgi:subtilisin
MDDGATSRRDVLRGAGVGLGALVVGTGKVAAATRQQYNVGTGTRAAERATRTAADNVLQVLDWGRGEKTLTVTLPDRAAQALQQRAGIRYVEVDGTMHAIGQTLPWGIDRVDADVLHDSGETGAGADIAIIDTGIDDDHPDLQANVGTGKAYVDCRGPNCNHPWSDDRDHGTHCAGIADAEANNEGVVGVSTGATLHAVKVLDKKGSGSFSDVAAGIKYTADQNWDVGSLSLGSTTDSGTVKDACQYADERGVLLVAAAGNDGPCTDCVGYPAAYSTVIGVSSTDSDDTLSSFSSTGPEVELAAPGGRIYSTVIGGYQTASGTSMACPHVAGAGGQLMAKGYTNTEARDRLTSTAENIGLSSNEQGSGLLDAEAALAGSTDSAPTVSWVNPSGGDTIGGTVTVKVAASDSEDSDDSLDVVYSVDSGTSRSMTYNSTSGYYEDTWDSTTVSDDDHTFETSATDASGNTTTSTITSTTDNIESAPTVDSLAATEVETSDADAEFDVDWSVGDSDGNLDSVTLVLRQDSDGSTEDSASVSVSGDTASGTTRLVAAGDDGSGNSYTVDATVTDAAGNTGTGSTSSSETEITNSAPTIDSYAVTEAGSPNPHAEITADWNVGDTDGTLATVVVDVLDSTGAVVSSSTTDVSGSDAAGTDEFQIKHSNGQTFDVTLTVTDAAGDATAATQTVTA